jgi:hypothetical protein
MRGAQTSPADLDLSGRSRRSRETRSSGYPDRGSALGNDNETAAGKAKHMRTHIYSISGHKTRSGGPCLYSSPESKFPFISFYLFFGIGAFQWVTADSNKKLFLISNLIAHIFAVYCSHVVASVVRAATFNL